MPAANPSTDKDIHSPTVVVGDGTHVPSPPERFDDLVAWAEAQGVAERLDDVASSADGDAPIRWPRTPVFQTPFQGPPVTFREILDGTPRGDDTWMWLQAKARIWLQKVAENLHFERAWQQVRSQRQRSPPTRRS